MKRIPLSALLATIALFYLLAFYPGYMSYDSAYHYDQLESGDWTTFQPVIILLFWKVTDVLIEGPGGMFLLFLGIYLTALWLMAKYMRGGKWQRVLMLASAVLPLNFMIFPHIWKDIGLLVFTLLALGWILGYLNTQKKWMWLASVLSVLIAVLFRFEAILYLWPLVYYQINQIRAEQNTVHKSNSVRHHFTNMLFVATFAVVGLLSNKALVELSGTRKVTLWPTVALWDIARVSIREDQVLLPSYTVGPGMTVEDLAQATYDWTNTSLFSDTKAGVNNGLYEPYSDEQYAELMRIWVTLPIRYPVSYAKHRLRLGSDLLRIVESENKSQGLFWLNQIVKYDDRFHVNSSIANKAVNYFLSMRKDDVYFKPWFYVLIGFGLLVVMLRTNFRTPQQWLALSLLVSSMLSVGVMLFLAPAAEQRYLIIMFNFVPMAGLLIWSSRYPNTPTGDV